MEQLSDINSEVANVAVMSGTASFGSTPSSRPVSGLNEANASSAGDQSFTAGLELDRPNQFSLQFEADSIRLFTEVLDDEGDIVTRIPPASLRTALAAFGLSDGPFSVQSFV